MDIYYQRIDSGSEETLRRTSRTFVRLYWKRSTEGSTIGITVTTVCITHDNSNS
jgi:lactam utilization protein B